MEGLYQELATTSLLLCVAVVLAFVRDGRLAAVESSLRVTTQCWGTFQ